MGRYHHDFEPGGAGGGGKKPLPAHKRTAIAYFVLAAAGFVAAMALPLLAAIF